MAKKRFLVTEDSFIGLKFIKAESKEIVEIETDVSKGGMTPGGNLLEVDADGNPVTDSKPSRSARAAPPVLTETTSPTGDGSTDLA